MFPYEKYTTNQGNLEEGLFKSKLLIQVCPLYLVFQERSHFWQSFKAIFTSPSSAKDVAGDGDGANIIENN
jgi:hypothetical protein